MKKELMPDLLPERREARPTAHNLLSAFQGLGLTYTGRDQLALDRLTGTQRRILELLGIPLPWPERPR